MQDADHNKIAVEIFDKLAVEYQAKFMDVAHYHASLDLFCDSIAAQAAAVLEVACGPGNITQHLLHKRPDLRILGTDLAPKMLALAAHNNPSATFQVLDARAIGSLGRQFDAIMSGFCLPYLTKAEAVQFIADAALQLRAGGVLYLSTMEDDYSKSGWRTGSQGDQIYMHFHEADYLEAALIGNGFEIIALLRQPYPPTGEPMATDLIILARKGCCGL